MNYFNASAHADKIRGNDGTGRFATQQSAESTLVLSKLDAKWDLSGHDEFYDEDGRLNKLVRYKGLKPDDGDDGSPAVILFNESGRRTEKRYREGVLHDGSGAHGSIETYAPDGSVQIIQRGFHTPGLEKRFRNHNSPDGQPGEYRVHTNGSTHITQYIDGRRVSPRPGVPGYTIIKPDGTHTEVFFDEKGNQHERSPGDASGFMYYPDGSLTSHTFYLRGKAVNGPRGVHAETFHPDGHTSALHYVYYEDPEYGNPYMPRFKSVDYASPRPVDAIIDGPLTMPEIVDRVDENGLMTVRVRVPLTQQRGSLLTVSGIFDLDEVSTVKADIPRNRTVFDVTCDASKVTASWQDVDEDKNFTSKYWSAVLKEKRQAQD